MAETDRRTFAPGSGPESERRCTPLEIASALAAAAILAVVLCPLLVRSVDRGQRARALADSQAIGRAILAFQIDTGRWPVSDDGDPSNAGEISRLVGLPRAALRPANLPPGTDDLASGWQRSGAAGALEDHLVLDSDADTPTLYATSNTPPDPAGWAGPYLRAVPRDPWDHPYVCDVRYLRGAGVGDVTPAQAGDHSVFCLSAGPDGRWNTPLADDTPLDLPLGDDIGFPIQAREPR